MVYGIVKNHHGYIECASEPGAGTRFNIYFPVIKSEKIQQDDISTQTENIPTGNETILLVDDDDSNLDAAKRMLQHFGYQVTAVNNAEKALEIYLAEKEKIDLVILDPKETGRSASRPVLSV